MSSSPASTGPKPSSAMPARWAASARAAAIRSASARLPVTRCGELADGGGLVREPTAVPVQTVALAGDLGGAGGHLAALVLDPALGLVLLGVLEAGQAALQRLALGPAGLPVRLGRPLGGDGDAAGRGRARQPLGVIGGDVGPGLHPVQRELHMGTEVRLIVRPELAHGRVGGGQVVEQLLHGGEVLEVPGGLLDEVVIDRGEAGGQRVRDLGRVQVLGQQRAAQRQQQVEELGVALPAEAEQAVIDQVPVLGRGLPPGVRLEDGAELAFGQRAGVGRQQPEVHADPLAGDEERHPHAVGVPVGAHADDQRHGLGAGLGRSSRSVAGAAGARPGTRELHPDVAVFGFLTAEQQVGLHRPVLAGERVEAAGVGHPVEDEREEDLECLGLAGAVVTAQGEAAVGERPLLVHVVPDVDHAGPGRLEPVSHRRCHRRCHGRCRCRCRARRWSPPNRSSASWPSACRTGSAALMFR